MTWTEVWQKIKNFITSDAIWSAITKVAIALVLLFITFKIINIVTRRIEKRALKKNADKTIIKTLMYILRIVLKIVVVICLVGFVGINTSGITALITSLGVCAGLAVNGALSNFAGGVMIILTRPFKVDDFIEAQGFSGTVEEIRITNTKIITPDNKVVYIPNGVLSSETIINYSEKDIRRVDMVFSIGYSDDYEKAKGILEDILNSHPLVLKDPAITVVMAEHGASSININARGWAKNGDYWTVKNEVTVAVKKAFDENGIEIPFNQLDVHIKQD